MDHRAHARTGGSERTMWIFVAMIVVIVLLVLYLNHRGATGAGDNFASSEADSLPHVDAKFGQIKKKR